MKTLKMPLLVMLIAIPILLPVELALERMKNHVHAAASQPAAVTAQFSR